MNMPWLIRYTLGALGGLIVMVLLLWTEEGVHVN